MKRINATMFVFALATAVHADVVSNFETGLNGWTGDAPAFQHTWGSTGGNPGGYADFLDQDGGTGILNAPAAFLGDWSALDGVGRLSWDSILFNESFGPSVVPFELYISGPGGAATFSTSANANVWYSWVHVTAPIDPNSWNVTSGSWSSLLSNVTSLRILTERISNAGMSTPAHPGDHCGIDNFTLSVCNLMADLNSDGVVDLSDLTTLLANFGRQSGASHTDGDLNGDSAVSLADLAALLAQFGTACP